MADREKVIKALMELHGSKETIDIIHDAISLLKEQEKLEERLQHAIEAGEEYRKEWDIMREALTVLKEQEAKSPVIREKNGYWDYVCPTCGSHDEELFREWNYCPFCGQVVKWE